MHVFVMDKKSMPIFEGYGAFNDIDPYMSLFLLYIMVEHIT